MKNEGRLENSLGKRTAQDLKFLIMNRFEKSKKNDSLTKKGNTFQLEGNEILLEQLTDTDSKDIRTFR